MKNLVEEKPVMKVSVFNMADVQCSTATPQAKSPDLDLIKINTDYNEEFTIKPTITTSDFVKTIKRKEPVMNPRIKTWRPKDESEELVSYDGKIFMVHFDRIFGEKFGIYNMFQIKKISYEKKLPLMVRYINYFEKFYDTSHELMYAYLKIKFALEKDKLFGKNNMSAFIGFIYEVMFSDSMVKAIEKMSLENYLDDIEEETEDKANYMKNELMHKESLRFTNQHIRILLSISMGMKILSPSMFHYFAYNNIKIEKHNSMIYDFYANLFNLFKQDCDMYNKLFVYVKAKVMEANSNNAVIFAQREVYGVDLYSVVDQFLKVQFITDNMVKYQYSETWDPTTGHYKENILGFNKTVLKFQVHYFLKEAHPRTLTEVSNAKNNDGLSGSDKMQANLSKIDESIPIQADININSEIRHIKSILDIEISDEEIDYYVKNLHPDDLQTGLVRSYYAKFFGSYTELKLINNRDYVTLLLILKKKLLLELGYDKETKEPVSAALPYILTGNVMDKVNTRLVRNTNFKDRVNNSYVWEKLSKEKYRYLNEISPDYIMQLLSTYINTTFSYVTYEFPEMTGKEILYSDDKISDELLFFLEQI